MFRQLLTGMTLGLCFSSMAFAEPIDDALVIVDNTIDAEQYARAFEGMGELMLGMLQNELSKEGKTISRDAGLVYVGMMTSHMTDALVAQMREPLAKAYVANLTPETLAAYRAFLETDAGREVAATKALIMRESIKIGEDIAVAVATPAVAAAQADIEADNWPAGTLKTTQVELRELFGFPPVSDDPPAR